jgi:hypothetical protein
LTGPEEEQIRPLIPINVQYQGTVPGPLRVQRFGEDSLMKPEETIIEDQGYRSAIGEYYHVNIVIEINIADADASNRA